jgi:hypothetical protein
MSLLEAIINTLFPKVAPKWLAWSAMVAACGLVIVLALLGKL